MRAAYIVLALALVPLGGCRAMLTQDHEGRAYDNHSREYYVDAKRSRIGAESHAYAWRDGELGGACSGDADEPVVDEARIEAVTLFDTGSDRLRRGGEAVLERLAARVARYESVRSVTLFGHADHRGPARDNEALSARRIESARRHLAARLPVGVPVLGVPRGEADPLPSGAGPDPLSADRRVLVRVVAEDAAPGRASVALCARAPSAGSGPARARPAARYVEPGAGGLDRFGGTMPLSPGDRLRVRVAGDESLDGVYELGPDGALDLPFVGPTPALGLRVEELEARLRDRLVDGGFVRAGFARVDVGVMQLSLVDVYVRGAVFEPGRKTVNALEISVRAFKQTQDGGDAARDRLLSTALQVSGGVRPDADLSAVRVTRGDQYTEVNLEGVLSGVPTEDFPLVEGDEIEVPSLGAFRESLVRPSQITPPGVRIFVSNLAAPALTNSSSSVDKDATSLPYGARLLHALLSANCVGGTQLTNASRRAVLISANPLTGRTEVIERSVQQLVSDPDRDEINPLLMPNDGVACYDSGITNLRDVARGLSEALAPFALLRTIFP